MESYKAEASLHPPTLPDDDDDDDAALGIPWALLDLNAYVTDRRNHTTAFARTVYNTEIQVTFFLARPPRVSYFCAFCPGRDHTELPTEPKVLAMDGDLVLLRVVVGPGKKLLGDCDHYIYQANGDGDGKPSLDLLPRPAGPGPLVFDYEFTGLLRCRDDHDDDDGKGGVKKAEFIIAALCYANDPAVRAHLPGMRHLAPGSESDERYALFLYNSKDKTWTANLVSLDKQQQLKQPGADDCFLHFTNKVIAIGGEAGTMGFVDLYRGIILCDVLRGSGDLKLRYAPLPPPIRQEDDMLRSEAPLERDIAVVKGRIRFLELEVNGNPSLVAWDGRYTGDGWMVRTWSRPVVAANSVAAANAVADDWVIECEIVSSDEVDVESNPHFELLPMPQDKNFQPLQLPPFRGLAVCHPALSLSDDDDDTVYLMNKIFNGDTKAWVMAVDVRRKELLGVARFAAERTEISTFAYAHSRISKYLSPR